MIARHSIALLVAGTAAMISGPGEAQTFVEHAAEFRMPDSS